MVSILKLDEVKLFSLMKTFNYQMGGSEPFKSDEDIQLSNGMKGTF